MRGKIKEAFWIDKKILTLPKQSLNISDASTHCETSILSRPKDQEKLRKSNSCC